MSIAQNEEDTVDITRQLSAAQQLPPDLMLLKMENEQIFSVARMVPRDPMKIVKQLRELIDAYPAAADEAIYSKPVGTVMRVTCHDCGIKYEVTKIDQDTICPACDSKKHVDGRRVKKFAEGLSIRAAESIRSIYGYTRLSTTTELLQDGNAKITGVLVDYAAGNVTSDERIVSPWYKSRSGQMAKTPEDRFLGVVVKAEKSKLKRDVILDSVPNIVKALFRDECEKKLVELVAPEIVEQKILPAFAEYGISLTQLEKIVGRTQKLGWREEERLALRKILTALKNEETTVRELLADLDDDDQQTGKTNNGTNGPVKASDLTSPKQATQTESSSQKQQDNRSQSSETIQTDPSKTENAPRQPGPTTMVGNPPYGRLFDQYLAELSACDQVTDASAVYDKWFGPDRPCEWPPEFNDKACRARDERANVIRANRRPQRDGSLFDKPATTKA